MAKEKKYYTYTLADPRDGIVFYVGKGSGDRVSQHSKQTKAGRPQPNTAKTEKIKSILSGGLEVVEFVVERFDRENEAYEGERRLIKKYGFENLTNAVDEYGRNQNRKESEEPFYYPRRVLFSSDLEFYEAFLAFVESITPKEKYKRLYAEILEGARKTVANEREKQKEVYA